MRRTDIDRPVGAKVCEDDGFADGFTTVARRRCRRRRCRLSRVALSSLRRRRSLRRRARGRCGRNPQPVTPKSWNKSTCHGTLHLSFSR